MASKPADELKLSHPDGLEILPEGLQLFLEMPRNCELSTGELRLRAVDDTQTQHAPIDCRVSSDQGEMTTSSKDVVNWLLVDLGTDRIVAGLKIDVKPNSKSQSAVYARMKVSQNNVWVPLTPIDILAVGTWLPLSPVVTSKLMIEFVQPLESEGLKTADNKSFKIPGAWLGVPVTVNSKPEIYPSPAPCDVNLAVGDAEPFFSYVGVLPGGTGIPVKGLKDVVNNYLNESVGTKIPLILRAAIPGRIEAPSITKASVVSVRNKWEGGEIDENGRMIVPWQGEAVASVNIGSNAEITEVAFQVEVDLAQECLLLGPGSTESSSAQLCNTRYATAQGFKFDQLPGDTTLIGLDLYLHPTQLPVKATITLCPDDLGRPARQPYPGACADFLLEDRQDSVPQPKWLNCRLSKPFPLKPGALWAVLTVEVGEFHWRMGAIPESDKSGTEKLYSFIKPNPAGVLDTMYRIGKGPWLARSFDDPRGPLWGLSRLRAKAPELPEAKICLRRNRKDIILKPDAQMQVKVTRDELKALNEEMEESLQLVVSGDAAGTVTISKPCIKFKPKPHG